MHGWNLGEAVENFANASGNDQKWIIRYARNPTVSLRL